MYGIHAVQDTADPKTKKQKKVVFLCCCFFAPLLFVFRVGNLVEIDDVMPIQQDFSCSFWVQRHFGKTIKSLNNFFLGLQLYFLLTVQLKGRLTQLTEIIFSHHERHLILQMGFELYVAGFRDLCL